MRDSARVCEPKIKMKKGRKGKSERKRSAGGQRGDGEIKQSLIIKAYEEWVSV